MFSTSTALFEGGGLPATDPDKGAGITDWSTITLHATRQMLTGDLVTNKPGIDFDSMLALGNGVRPTRSLAHRPAGRGDLR
jgi:hypothetical protein